MICPHCRKPIDKRVTEKAIDYIRALDKQGWSLREIEKELWNWDSVQVSFSTIRRLLKKGETK